MFSAIVLLKQVYTNAGDVVKRPGSTNLSIVLTSAKTLAIHQNLASRAIFLTEIYTRHSQPSGFCSQTRAKHWFQHISSTNIALENSPDSSPHSVKIACPFKTKPNKIMLVIQNNLKMPNSCSELGWKVLKSLISSMLWQHECRNWNESRNSFDCSRWQALGPRALPEGLKSPRRKPQLAAPKPARDNSFYWEWLSQEIREQLVYAF